MARRRALRSAVAVLAVAATGPGCAEQSTDTGAGDRSARFESPADPLLDDVHELVTDVDGRRRDALVVVPDGLGAGPVPLVVVLHGLGGDARSLATNSGFTPLAAQEGFVVAYPAGIDDRWHDGSIELFEGEVDDVAYLVRLIEDVEDLHPIDRDRVFVAGFSNGAGMAVRLACDAPGVLAGIGLVAGGNVGDGLGDCEDLAAVSAFGVHGTADRVVRFEGGQGWLGSTPVPAFAVRDLAGHFAAAAGCEVEPTVSPTPAGDRGSGPAGEVWEHRGCRDGHQVRFVAVSGGGHEWFGGVAEQLWGLFSSTDQVPVGTG